MIMGDGGRGGGGLRITLNIGVLLSIWYCFEFSRSFLFICSTCTNYVANAFDIIRIKWIYSHWWRIAASHQMWKRTRRVGTFWIVWFIYHIAHITYTNFHNAQLHCNCYICVKCVVSNKFCETIQWHRISNRQTYSSSPLLPHQYYLLFLFRCLKNFSSFFRRSLLFISFLQFFHS